MKDVSIGGIMSTTLWSQPGCLMVVGIISTTDNGQFPYVMIPDHCHKPLEPYSHSANHVPGMSITSEQR